MTELSATSRQTYLIELRLWRQFVVLAEELHFSNAAVRLNMTQPPLTQAIAHLEAVLGVKLFDRTKRSVQMTAAGLALLPEARDLLARAQALPVRARAAAGGEVGRLRLGFVSTVGFLLLPQWVRAFRERYPQIALDLIEATGDVQLQLLDRGEIDAGFMLHSPGFAPPNLACELVTTEPLVLALPEQHPLAAVAKPLLAKVLVEPLVIFPRRIVPSLHDAIFGMYHAAGRLPQIVQEAIQMQTIVNLVSAGLGVAWVSQSVQQFRRSGVVYRNVVLPKSAAKVPVCDTSLVWAHTSSNPALARFVDFVLQTPENT
ncbi:MAG: LysR substrate-binding domain-containing protein [Polaromonas sp.]|jgi:DNA-binding transcriptional LysR family regulator